MQIRPVAIDQIIDLRHVVLRHGLPREAAIFEGDRTAGARHYGAFENEELIGCVTLLPSKWEDQPAWQLRGMAVAEGFRSRGVGRSMLQYLETDVSQSPVHQLWCNARVPAARFYQNSGWTVVSEVFEIPTAGPHVKMTRRLGG